MERENLLRASGYTIQSMWECEWNDIKQGLDNKEELEQMARDANINVRDALHGGRTEGFKTYVKCTKTQKIHVLDVTSLYPAVNALDDYGTSFKKYVKTTVEVIASGEFTGLVKCDVIPPTDLYVPVLPQSRDGKLLFHVKPCIIRPGRLSNCNTH